MPSVVGGLGPPELVALAPVEGRSLAGSPIAFTAIVRDPDGWHDLREVHLLLTDDFKTRRPIFLYYDVQRDQLFVRNQANTEWLGGVTPGTHELIDGGPVKLDASRTVVSTSDEELTVTWTVVVEEPLAGITYDLYYAAVEDSFQATEWARAGSWTVEFREERRPP